uniref:Ig-like domain-containing protein n=1 Tax=Phasianus colchicus TaxID=9054 RepID=A0A669R1N8_PHACC
MVTAAPTPPSPSLPQLSFSPPLSPARCCPHVPPAGSQPPLLTMDPPWTPQFIGQNVKLTCGDPSVSISTTWYKDGRRWEETPSNHLSVTLRDEGKHRWQLHAGASPCSLSRSPTVWLLLQVPAQAVLEGDLLSLRCSGWEDRRLREVQFFRDGKLLQDSGGDKLLLSPAKQQQSGRYHCSAKVHYFHPGREVSPQADLDGFGVDLGWIWG